MLVLIQNLVQEDHFVVKADKGLMIYNTGRRTDSKELAQSV